MIREMIYPMGKDDLRRLFLKVCAENGWSVKRTGDQTYTIIVERKFWKFRIRDLEIPVKLIEQQRYTTAIQWDNAVQPANIASRLPLYQFDQLASEMRSFVPR